MSGTIHPPDQTASTPPAEITITPDLVRALLRDQHPDLAHLPVEPFENGWDNTMFRLGPDFLVRLPRRAIAATLIENEQRWLPVLAPHLPCPIPEPIRMGRPNAAFPWCWSILPWLEGAPADENPLSDDAAGDLAAFLSALHRPAPDDAPENPYRGVDLRTRKDGVEERLARLRDRTDAITPAIDHAWQTALAAPPSKTTVWLHGDCHARNVLTADGRLSAVIDWGDITSGDAATDLAAIWMLLGSAEARQHAWARYGAQDDALYARAMGWAVLFGAVLLDTGLSDTPRHAAMGAVTLARIHTDCQSR